MISPLPMLVAYDEDGNVIATLHKRVARGIDGEVIGFMDFAAHEAAGGENLDVWRVERVDETPDGTQTRTPARGSKVWPERIDSSIHDFTVELEGPAGKKRIAALVHKRSGFRRTRPVQPRAVELDEDGRTTERPLGATADVPVLEITGDGLSLVDVPH